MSITQKQKELQKDQNGIIIMSLKSIEICCERQELFSTPQLNDKLYLHFKGFHKIQNLHRFINLKALWLNNNAISEIQNLEYCQQLVTLYLNNNLIRKIRNLHFLEELVILNLSHNRIDKIQNLEALKKLNSLNVSQNLLSDSQSIQGVNGCQSIASLDLSDNVIQSDASVFETLKGLTNLACLYLRNTPMARGFKAYRKSFISGIPTLKFLDDRPVFQNERRIAEAWAKGGAEQENLEKIKIGEDRQKYNKKIFEDFEKLAGPPREKRKYISGCLSKPQREKLQYLKLQREQLQSDEQSNHFRIEEINLKIEQLIKYIDQLQQACQYIGVNENSQPEDYQITRVNGAIKIINKLTQESQKDKMIESIVHQIEREQSEKSVKQGPQTNLEQQIQTLPIKLIEKEQKEEQINAMKKWNPKFEQILQLLLEKYKFDFEEVYPEFNMIISDIYKKTKRPIVRFEAKELCQIWTIIEKQKRNHLQELD